MMKHPAGRPAQSDWEAKRAARLGHTAGDLEAWSRSDWFVLVSRKTCARTRQDRRRWLAILA
eukprot:3017269-Pleurochrysis_carterae.AAC.3